MLVWKWCNECVLYFRQLSDMLFLEFQYAMSCRFVHPVIASGAGVCVTLFSPDAFYNGFIQNLSYGQINGLRRL